MNKKGKVELGSFLTGKTVLVTGGTGSIGSEIVTRVLDHDVQRVVVFSRDEIKHFLMRRRLADDRLETVVGDVRNPRSLEEVFRRFKIDVIYHAAAMKHVVVCEESPRESVETNVLGTQHVVDLALSHGVSKMVTISTDKAAFPTTVMGATKLIAETVTLNGNWISGNRQQFSCVRFGNVANSRGSVIPVYVENLLYGRPLQVTDAGVTRFIMEIPAAARLVVDTIDFSLGGEVFILKMRAFNLGDLVQVMLERIAPRMDIARERVKVRVTGLLPGEKLHEDLINDGESARLYEMGDKYVLLRDGTRISEYGGICKAKAQRYCSADVDLLSQDELEELVMKHLKTISLINSK